MSSQADSHSGTPTTPLISSAIIGGTCAGLVLGAAEVAWLTLHTAGFKGMATVAWAPAAMAILSIPVGLAIALLGSFASAAVRRATDRDLLLLRTTGFVLGGTLFAGCVTIARWRFYLDFDPWVKENAVSGMSVLTVSIVVGALTWVVVCDVTRRISTSHAVIGCVTATLLLSVVSAFRIAGGSDEATETATSTASNLEHGSGTQPPSKSLRPDIVLIVADTLRADFISGYNPASLAKTPSIDKLAREGIRFANYCAGSTWTKPTFASMFTGLDPPSHTAVNRESILPDEVTTVAEVLQAAGYHTAGYSNANPNNSSFVNFDQGFDEFFDLRRSDAWLGGPWSTTQLIVYQRVIEPVAKFLLGVDVHHFYQPADAYTSLVLDWLNDWQRRDGPPLFLVLHYMDPHAPYMSGKHVGRSTHRSKRSDATYLPPVKKMQDGYARDIEFMDTHLERLFDGMRELGMYDDAIIVFTSDHGEEFLEHRWWGHGDSLYGELTAVPLIIKLPEQAGAGGLAVEMASQVDLSPTLLSLADVGIPEVMQGNRLVRSNGDIRQTGREYCFASLDARGNRLKSVTSPDAALINGEVRRQLRLARVEFYDLNLDPGQRENLAGSHDPRERQLALVLEDAVTDARNHKVKSRNVELEGHVALQLRALGYVHEQQALAD